MSISYLCKLIEQGKGLFHASFMLGYIVCAWFGDIQEIGSLIVMKFVFGCWLVVFLLNYNATR